MKKLACITAVCLASSLSAVANAGADDLTRALRGAYAFSGEGTCVGAPPSANWNGFQPSFGAHLETFAVEGVRQFNGDGTGSVKGRVVGINVKPGGPVPFGPVNNATFSANFTYSVAADRSIHIEHGPMTSVQVFGPGAGTPNGSSITTGLRVDGHVSQDFNTIVIATSAVDPNNPSSALETVTDSNGNVDEYRFCHRSRTLTRIGGGRGRDD